MRNQPRVKVTPAREVAYEVLRRVTEEDAYANLVLPALLRSERLEGREAAFATELTYGTLRLRGRYDAIISLCMPERDVTDLDTDLLDILRLGAHQLLTVEVPPHAAIGQAVQQARNIAGHGATGLVNAVLRRVSERTNHDWLLELAANSDPDRSLAAIGSHPDWIVRSFKQALSADGRDPERVDELLAANNRPPAVNLVARPGLITTSQLASQAERVFDAPTAYGNISPTSVILSEGDPGRLEAIRSGKAAVQDEGSQLLAHMLAAAPLDNPPLEGGESWFDACAGPGGKTAVLAGLAQSVGARLTANEITDHRADLVEKAVAAYPGEHVRVIRGDGREIDGHYHRVLVDAPCTGLGSLRRRPEARWRKKPSDVGPLSKLQSELLEAAIAATYPGGVIAFTTCTPHLAETRAITASALRRHPELELLDAVQIAESVTPGLAARLGEGPQLQLWPHIHGSDAMYCAIFRRKHG